MSDLREKIIASNDRTSLKVPVPEWGCDIYVQSVSAAEREAWEASLEIVDGVPQAMGARCRFLVKCLVDENHVRIFFDGDAEELSSKSSLIIDRLWEAANRVNAVAEKSVEEKAGN